MLKKKSIGVALACALALGAWSGSTLATPINVNGVHWDSSNQFDLTFQSLNLRETPVSIVGDMLHGYGQIGSINGVNSFCTGCDLTFTFTYTVKSIIGNQVAFNMGSFQFYTQAAGSFDFGNPTSVGGTPWLTLIGHTAPRAGFADPSAQLYAMVNGTISAPTAGSGGFGLVDATGGPAKFFVNTNSIADGIGGFADFNLASSFSFFPSSNCSTVTTNLSLICSYPIEGNGSLVGRSTVPEPNEMGLLGLGLAFLGLLVGRRRKETEGRV
ncbi:MULTISPECIES: PEP-CTERM sorting domain-containing protein [Rhodanobacter]|uniref:PEP-CTERM sorting domain-containing protein n=1 Tax=Rhodanobacter TaxID=75309 RepID=UPI000481167D|nr:MULTISPECIES: PEP-CTERM sorting domain-containing protein [Rhodanobacter]UJM92938.1 PEP-CTERM sorting domain-containing protein [Rhodanobacter denitrificans]UJM96468.1 PEP-CTERM sorting domain-containing protein [Rhodanobacter denitrificans]UJN20701.1 PEP-CTERM sorting domain-containing protein [Rhodanobacter denitrificans]